MGWGGGSRVIGYYDRLGSVVMRLVWGWVMRLAWVWVMRWLWGWVWEWGMAVGVGGQLRARLRGRLRARRGVELGAS